MRTRPFSTFVLAFAVASGTGCIEAPITGVGSSSSTTADEDSSVTLRILVDATRDGGVWWFPQEGPFDPDRDHQGKALADYLRLLDYTVTEVGRDGRMTRDLAESHNVIVRVGGCRELHFICCPGIVLPVADTLATRSFGTEVAVLVRRRLVERSTPRIVVIWSSRILCERYQESPSCVCQQVFKDP